MVVHRDRLVVLSFMAGASMNETTPNIPLNTFPLTSANFSLNGNSTSLTANQNISLFYNNFTGPDGPKPQPFSMVQTLKNILGAENIEIDSTGTGKNFKFRITNSKFENF